MKVVGGDGKFDALRFRNNVVVGAKSVIELPRERFTEGERDTSSAVLVASRNVVRNGAVQTAVQADRLSRPGVTVEHGDLAAEPGFVDPTGGDYRLRADSALIDAGVEPDGYVRDVDDPVDEDRRPPADDVERAVDGDGDGVARHDIGAFELSPERPRAPPSAP